jgi:peptidoglycan/xylan/chitin deacetylase (PgdA/CDA1 family)
MMHALTLLFHDAVPEGRWDESGFVGADADLYKLECAAFHRHLEAIRRKLKGQFATAPQLLAGTLTNDPCFLLSFDDGGVSAATHIADMLEEFGWRGHFLITAGRVGTAGFLDAAQIRDLHGRGHVIGSHSYSHPLLMAHCSTDQLYEEWHRSALVLSDILGAPITVASVPGGHYSHAVAVAAASAGMKLLFNSEPTTDMHLVDGCLVLGRFCVKRAHAPEWSGRIVAGDFAPKFKEAMLWNIKKVPKIILGDVWLRARQKILEHQAPHPRKRAS